VFIHARALARWTGVTLTLFTAGAVVITAIHPDFNPAVTITLIAGAVIAWLSHRRVADREQFDVLRQQIQAEQADFVTAVQELLDQQEAQVDVRLDTVRDLARLLLDRQYAPAPAVGGTDTTSADRPRLTAVK
jgi:hypothetical protein